MDIDVHRFGTIASTSLHAREVIERGDGPRVATAYVAAEQTGGVGRMGRAYCSPRGGLWLTLVVPFGGGGARVPREVVEGLGLRLGVACVEAVRGVMGGSGAEGRVELKWPNDVMVGGKKVLGILTELIRARTGADKRVGAGAVAGTDPPDGGSVARGGTRGAGAEEPGGFVCVGVGINCNFGIEALDASLRERATTLMAERGGPVDLAALEADVLARLVAAVCERGLPERTLAVARGALHGVGEAATIHVPGGEVVRGTLVGLDERGFVRVRMASGEEVVGVMPVGES